MRKILITCKADERERAWWDLWQLARGTFIPYAGRHGYEYREFWYNDFDAKRWPGLIRGRLPVWPLDRSMTSPCWLKIPAISLMLERFDLVVYLDNDCVILDHSRDISEELPRDKWLAMSDVTTSEGCGPNVGVVVCRSVPIAWQFWREAWDADWWRTAKWTDQGNVFGVLGYNHNPPIVKLRDSKYDYHALGEEWNGYGAGWGAVRPGTRIFHAAWGRSGEEKLAVMHAALKGAVNGPAK